MVARFRNANAPSSMRRETWVKLAAAGMAVAALCWVFWQGNRVRRLEAQHAEIEARAAKADPLEQEVERLKALAVDRAELDRLRAAEIGLRQEVARLRGQLGARLRVEAERATQAQAAPVASPGSLGTEATGGMAQMIKGVLDQQIQTQLVRMTDKVRLSPEQLTAYKEYKHEEAISNARLAANAELLQLQAMVPMEAEAQDQAFAALYDLTLSTLEGSISEGADVPKASDPAALIQWQVERKIKALEGVLTPEQLDGYRRLQENQMKLIKALLPSGSDKTAAP